MRGGDGAVHVDCAGISKPADHDSRCGIYDVQRLAARGIGELTVAVLPWLATMLIFLVMVTYIPALSLWLPHLLGML